jgi:UDP-glucose 4-epimerase
MNNSKFKSLVTGGAGFIGSHIVDELIKIGHEVVVIDNESAQNDIFYYNSKAAYHNLDICDYKSTRELYNSVNFVFHLAAESRLQPAIDNPINAVMQNSVGTCTSLQCSKEAGVQKFIYSSTSSAYGLNEEPNLETDTNNCLNPYSVSKVSGEELCKMYHELYGLKTIIFRYFNVFGERCPTKGQYAPVIGIFLRQLKSNQALTIVGDGMQKRDFIHVKDVANANILAALYNSETDSCFGQIYNVGRGSNESIKDIAFLISDDIKYLEEREGEAKSTRASISKIKEAFGWLPQIDVKNWIKSQLS